MTGRFSYDDLGRTALVTRGGNAGSVGYAYDLHGWLTPVSSRDFSEELHYAGGAGTPRYDGNISSMLWQTSGYAHKRGYRFEYDNLGRLREAVYGEGEALADRLNRYNEKVVEYSANGAIRRFQRRGRKDDGEYGKIDNLHITLDGNRPLKVTDDALPVNRYSSFNFVDVADGPEEYAYNGAGALTKDLNRGMTVEYDLMNRPRFMQFSDGNTVLYDYASDGTLEQVTHYYPFGGTFSDAGLNPALQQYKYNGKPLESIAGLDTYDYGARQYFPALPAWDRVDPLCEKYYNVSPYAYCMNNPVRFVDYKGNDVHPYGTREFEMIRNTLPKDTWQYIQSWYLLLVDYQYYTF